MKWIEPRFDRLRVEMQLRSRLQHSWATAVETVGMFRGEPLKSSRGDEEWLRFFALMGTAIAIREGAPPVPNTPTGPTLITALREYCNKLDVVERLNNYRNVLRISSLPAVREAGHYFILEFNSNEDSVRVRAFRKREIEAASKEYLELERSVLQGPERDAVLVSVDDVKALKRAYPNYFLATPLSW